MHKVFVSYHHQNDQYYKESLLAISHLHSIFIDASVDTGNISDSLDDQAIRTKIRDEYLKDSTVTILLVGSETKLRKHVDWEIYSSMYDGTVNKKSGILVLNLPTSFSGYFDVGHNGEKGLYPANTNWTTVTSRADYEARYPFAPARIIDNLLEPNAKISVANWSRVENDPNALRYLIDVAYADRAACEYNLSRPMRRANS